MKNIKYFLVVLIVVASTSGCKKFLNVTPIDALSGNNYWKTKTDVELFMNGIYGRLRDKVGGSNSAARSFFPMLEMRENFTKVVGFNGSNTIVNLTNNNMKAIVAGDNAYDRMAKNIMNWKSFYDIIAASNILIYEVGNMPSNSLSDLDKKQYIAEAVFLRNLSYLFISRLFGDAVYYTEPYNSTPLPRIPQVDVMKNCIADMSAYKNDLPVSFSDQRSNGFRPTQAAATALLMHLNMWAAGWDTGDKKPYYTAVLSLIDELKTFSNYRVLPVNEANTKAIFKGRSAENLFGVLQETNYGETFAQQAGYSFYFSHYPYVGTSTNSNSIMTYDDGYISKLFPPGEPDSRLTTWFENYNSGNGSFQFKKFINTYTIGSGATVTATSDDSAIIFRLPDAILLGAEAAAELNQEDKARVLINEIRTAAAASPITTAGQELKDDIFRERCRELMGEGHFFTDLVRTKRIFDGKFCSNPISVGDFNAGAWTWPLILSQTDKTANPFLVGNNFWN